jgi:hypothetical protein
MMFAEGTREVAPNAMIQIEGNQTNDLAALLINDERYNTFASYDNEDPNARLYIHIANPDEECVYLGFSFAHPNASSPNPTRFNYEYRVKDPNGNIVFGPVFVSETDANIETWSEAAAGPLQLNGSSGYNAMQITSTDLTSQGWSGKGDYYVEFQSPNTNNEFLIDYWDISVASCISAFPVEKKGRVWSYNWAFFAINDYGFPNRPFNGAFYVCAPDPDNIDAAFITRIDFNESGFRPAAFNIAFNSFGIQNTGDIIVDRRSVEEINATQAEYAVFLNDPIDICETADPGGIELFGVSRCPGEEFCIKFIASKAGQIDLLLDFDGQDRMYSPGTADIMLTKTVTAEEVGVRICLEWDGLDGLGNFIPDDATSQIPILIAFAQGVYHFPIYDAELMTSGFNIQAIRPLGEKPLLYYDDSKISVPSESGEPAIQLMGCGLPCHRWTNYIDNTVVGFGNLNTINSWWFSQLSIQEEVFFFPGELQCSIDGPSEICEGEVETLSILTQVEPPGGAPVEIVSLTWSGPDIIGDFSGESIMIGGPGIYTVDVSWANFAGDTCFTTCEHTVTSLQTSEEVIDTLVISGEAIDINGEIYSEGGIYIQKLIASNGCDSTLTIILNIIQTIVNYDLDACRSYTDDGSAEDYTEFTAVIPEPLSCANIQADVLFRENASVNQHSCTPGVFDSPAMCVSGLDDCTYDPGNEKAVIFEVRISPSEDTAVAVTGLSFYEKAPVNFDWIDGQSGPNNFPTIYGVRVLKNGNMIFDEQDIVTTNSWTYEVFNFQGLTDFIVDEPATFRFELLAYCLFGVSSPVAAWDLDEIQIQASCISPALAMRQISGSVSTKQNMEIGMVEMQLSKTTDFHSYNIDVSNENGAFIFNNLQSGGPYYLKPNKVDDYLRGVSTLDLIKIKRHLIGIEPFEYPYQYIAADANLTNSITAIDLVEFKKLILGIIDVLPYNQSWRFTQNELGNDLANPFHMEEVMQIDNLDRDINNIHFTGIKIGNVDGLSTMHCLTQNQNLKAEGFQLAFEDHLIIKDKIQTVDITTIEPQLISGIQFALNMEDIDVIEVVSGKIKMEANETYVTHKKFLNVSWYQTMPIKIEKGDRLLSLVIMARKSGQLSKMLSISDNFLSPEAYSGLDLNVKPVSFTGYTQPHIEAQSNIFEIVPNPFSDQSIIHFALDNEGPVKARFYKISGQLLYEVDKHYDKGRQTIGISKRDLNMESGVVVVQFESEKGIEVKRLLLQSNK